MGDSLSARAKALITAAEKASIGPWELRREDVIGPQSAKFPHRNPSLNRIHVTSETGPDDGAFIATARNDAPDIAKAYLELKAELEGTLESFNRVLEEFGDDFPKEDFEGRAVIRRARANVVAARTLLAKHEPE